MHLVQPAYPVCCRGSTIPLFHVADWEMLIRITKLSYHLIEIQAKPKFTFSWMRVTSCTIVICWKIITQTIFSPKSPACVLEMDLLTEISKHIINFPFYQHFGYLETQSPGSNRKLSLELAV